MRLPNVYFVVYVVGKFNFVWKDLLHLADRCKRGAGSIHVDENLAVLVLLVRFCLSLRPGGLRRAKQVNVDLLGLEVLDLVLAGNENVFLVHLSQALLLVVGTRGADAFEFVLCQFAYSYGLVGGLLRRDCHHVQPFVLAERANWS